MMGINDLNILRHHRVDYANRIDRDGSGRRSSGPLLSRVAISVAVIGLAFLSVSKT